MSGGGGGGGGVNDKPVRFGFVGAGGIAQRALAPAVHAATGAVLQAVAARDIARAEALQPAGRAYGDYRAVLEDPTVDVVYNALSNDGHLPWTLAALESGKPVLCEKPMALNPADLEQMIGAAERAGLLLVEAFWYRWHPRTRRLEQLLSQGALGPIHEVEAEFSFAGPTEGDLALAYRLDPVKGGGALYDVGCYALSAAHLALGPALEVDDVDVTIGPTGVDLGTSARLHVPAQSAAQSAAQPAPATPTAPFAQITGGIALPDRQVLRVVGEAATAAFSPPAFTSWRAASTLDITTPDGAVRQEHFATVDAYQLMVEAVAARLRGEEAWLPGLDHSRHVAATTAAIRARAIAMAKAGSPAVGEP